MTLPIPEFNGWLARTAWVQAQLKVMGKSFASIAREHGWTRWSVANAMRTPSYPQELAIAEALGADPRELFRDRYSDKSGKRLHRVHSTDAAAESNAKQDAAA